MIQSMTGFGSAEKDSFKVEIRSLNHRFLDVFIKTPQNLSRHELAMRSMVRERFSRGRFDIFISTTDGKNAQIRVNMDLARGICNALRDLKEELSLSGSINIETVAGFREVIMTEEGAYNEGSLYDAFGEALDKLQEMRKREGDAIARDMLSRMELLEKMKGEIARLRHEAVSSCREKFRERLHSLFGDFEYDENRILQEAALVAERTDISEEITRISSHFEQLQKNLRDGDTIGRKVEFLLQELNREVNTIASKSDDYRIAKISVDMKAEIEKLREQAQNIQ